MNYLILKTMMATILLSQLAFSFGVESSSSQYSTMQVAWPFLTTTEFTRDALTKTIHEEAEDIVADGYITDEEREEMSLELEQRLYECLDRSFEINRPNTELECLEHLANISQY